MSVPGPNAPSTIRLSSKHLKGRFYQTFQSNESVRFVCGLPGCNQISNFAGRPDNVQRHVREHHQAQWIAWGEIMDYETVNVWEGDPSGSMVTARQYCDRIWQGFDMSASYDVNGNPKQNSNTNPNPQNSTGSPSHPTTTTTTTTNNNNNQGRPSARKTITPSHLATLTLSTQNDDSDDSESTETESTTKNDGGSDTEEDTSSEEDEEQSASSTHRMKTILNKNQYNLLFQFSKIAADYAQDLIDQSCKPSDVVCILQKAIDAAGLGVRVVEKEEDDSNNNDDGDGGEDAVAEGDDGESDETMDVD